MATPYVGEIRLVGFNFAPQNWHLCDGSLLPISENDALFNLIGTTYGGDGQTTFALPDLRGRVPVHQGQASGLSPYIIGQTGGVTSVTVSTSQLPQHTHTLACQDSAGSSPTAAGNYFAQAAEPVYATPGPLVTMGSLVSTTGGSLPHDNMQPYLAMNYIIALYGVYPSQS